MTEQKRIKVLLAKAGLDGHDRGVKVVARTLMDAGMEVIYGGLRQSPEQIVKTALQEDVDVIGISLLSGAHMQVFPRVLQLMEENEIADKVLVGGGTILPEEIIELTRQGVDAIFPPDSSLEDIVNIIVDNVRNKPTKNLV